MNVFVIPSWCFLAFNLLLERKVFLQDFYFFLLTRENESDFHDVLE